MQLCIHCFVSGYVQGVFYRASTQRQAQEFRLTGWVRNLRDGRVEVYACGEQETLQKFYQWLQQGPSGATVNAVSYEEKPYESLVGFTIAPTV